MPYEFNEVEKKWSKKWLISGVYNFQVMNEEELFSENLLDKTKKKTLKKNFIVDSPPPTVSGALHIGHVFSYTQTDILVRFKRMSGFNVFYPMGWDDNGLPTERRVQNYFSIKCNPKLQNNLNWKKEAIHNQKNEEIIFKEVSRENFIEACEILTKEDEKVFKNLFISIGHSYDWNYEYSTISKYSRKISQLSFLDLVKKKLVFNKEMPIMWDVTFQSAISNAEIEDREEKSKFYNIIFKLENSNFCGGTPNSELDSKNFNEWRNLTEELIISTTRPELIPACVAITAHPDDERYQHLFGKKAITPLFEDEVPILPNSEVLINKGTGLMMVSTFGDAADVFFWKKSELPLKQIISKNGKILNFEFLLKNIKSKNLEKAEKNYNEISGLTIKKARKKIIEMLSSVEAIKSERDILHSVKFYEKGDLPIEYVISREWFIDILSHKEKFLELGRKINWHPEHMRLRYENWVENLNEDWCISRQRFFGVPFPVWYKIDSNSNVLYEEGIYPSNDDLPIDPFISIPKGYSENDRGKPNGFIGDVDVMDTWATSSLTPQIALKTDLFKVEEIPTDLRPQAHDIIRTWAFYTIVKCFYHEEKIPWKNIAVSGFIVDPDRKKMSKSKGNVVTPSEFIEEFSADAVRYWAGKAKLGTDTIFDKSFFTIGKKLVNKIYNAGLFLKIICGEKLDSLNNLENKNLNDEINFKEVFFQKIKLALDVAIVCDLKNILNEITNAFENYEYSKALLQTETFFWKFCDNFLELLKHRAYDLNEEKSQNSAIAVLHFSYKIILKLFAPFLPFVTEEVWNELRFSSESIHISSWPKFNEKEVKNLINCVKGNYPKINQNDFENELKNLILILEKTLSIIRMKKSEKQKSVKHPISKLIINSSEKNVNLLKTVELEISKTCNVLSEIEFNIKTDLNEAEEIEIIVKMDD